MILAKEEGLLQIVIFVQNAYLINNRSKIPLDQNVMSATGFQSLTTTECVNNALIQKETIMIMMID